MRNYLFQASDYWEDEKSTLYIYVHNGRSKGMTSSHIPWGLKDGFLKAQV